MKKAIILTALILALSFQASAQSIVYPPVPPGLPETVSIDSLNWIWGGHSFKLNIYTGAFTFHTKAQGDFSGTAKVVWFGQTDQFNPFFITLGAQSVITFSYSTKANVRKFGPGDFVVEGWIDVCTQTGSVTMGSLGGSYNIANSVVHSQCSGAPPSPTQHLSCIADGDNSLKFDTNTGQFMLTLNGQFRVAGIFNVVTNSDGFTVLRSPGDDNDLTLLINGDVGVVTLLSHRKLVVSFSGTVAGCP